MTPLAWLKTLLALLVLLNAMQSYLFLSSIPASFDGKPARLLKMIPVYRILALSQVAVFIVAWVCFSAIDNNFKNLPASTAEYLIHSTAGALIMILFAAPMEIIVSLHFIGIFKKQSGWKNGNELKFPIYFGLLSAGLAIWLIVSIVKI